MGDLLRRVSVPSSSRDASWQLDLVGTLEYQTTISLTVLSVRKAIP